MKNVDVFLFTEETDEGVVLPVRYTMTAEEVEHMYFCIESKCDLILFGEWAHHAQDIIKFRVTDSSDQQYRNL